MTIATDRRRAEADPFDLALDAAAEVRRATGVAAHDIAVILGSGWAAAADGLGHPLAEVELSSLPGFAAPTVPGHCDLARSLVIDHRHVLVLGGRTHLYEGCSADEVAHGVRTVAAAGCRGLVLTNAAGALRPEWQPGQIVVIRDHLNLTGHSPMVGPGPHAGLPGRFCDLTDAYSARLRRVAHEVDPSLPEGVYAGLLGGNYETPAEIAMLATLGADLVGMSTVLETIAARHLGLGVLGLSLVTNLAAGLAPAPLSHDDVLTSAAEGIERLVHLISGVLHHLWSAV